MRKLIVFSFLFMTNFASSSDGTFWNTMTGKWGIGGSLGSPTGVSSVYFLNEIASFDLFVGYDFDGDFNFHTDYIFNFTDAYQIDRLDMNFYYGAGLRVKNKSSKTESEGEFLFGPRVLIGTSHYLSSIPIEVGLELGGVLSLLERTDFDFEAFLNVRYYF